jgi:hypothetical protein
MAVQLEIRDGQPYWYLSPDIWAVPGSNPDGAPGTPVAGTPAYLWAHVVNHGSDPADGARVDFWWADPSGQVLRSNAHPIGSAFADLAPAGMPGSSQDVLCLVPWNVVVVNNGHECLVAVANHAGSSVPTPPPDDFNPPQYPEVAQKNLTVLMAAMLRMTQAVTIAAGGRADKAVRVAVEIGGALDERLLARLGLAKYRPAAHDGGLGEPALELKVPRGTRTAVHVAMRVRELAPETYALVNVVEHDRGRVLGGYGFVVIDGKKEARRAPLPCRC